MTSHAHKLRNKDNPMKAIKWFALVSIVVIACSWRFSGDEVTKSEQFLATFGDTKVAGRLRATANGAVFELFENHKDVVRDDGTRASRASLGLDQRGVSSLTLSDGRGIVRFHVTTDDRGATSLGISDNHGKTVWGVDVDAEGKVKVRTRMGVTPAERR